MRAPSEAAPLVQAAPGGETWGEGLPGVWAALAVALWLLLCCAVFVGASVWVGM